MAGPRPVSFSALRPSGRPKWGRASSARNCARRIAGRDACPTCPDLLYSAKQHFSDLQEINRHAGIFFDSKTTSITLLILR